MRKYLLLIACLGVFSANAQDAIWHTNLNEAVQVSKKSKKPLLLFFTGSDWCGWCIRLQKEVLNTSEFKTWANDNVILVELDFPRRTAQAPEIKEQNFKLQQFFGVRGYPTIWITNAVQGENSHISFEKLGSTGYVAGGPGPWLEGARQILVNNIKK